MRILFASIAAAGLLLSAGAVQAQTASVTNDLSFGGVDTDRDGLVSWGEFNLVFPDITEEQFKQADADANGTLSEDEFDTLQISTGSIAPAPIAPQAPNPATSLTYTAP